MTDATTRRRLHRLGHGLVIALAAAALAGCANLPGRKPGTAKQTYLLQWPEGLQVSPSGAGRACHALLVTPPRSAPGFASTGMAYSQTPYDIAYFAYHQWVDTPGRMLEPLLVQALQRSGMFAAVVPSPTPARADLRLDTEVLRLVQDFRNHQSEVRLDMRVRLFDLKSRAVLADRVITTREPAEEGTPAAGVAAANRALVPLLRSLIETVRAPLARGQAPCTGG